MAYELEPMIVATEAFLRDVCEQLEGVGEENTVKVVDLAAPIASDLAICHSQAEVNDTLLARLQESPIANNPEMLVTASCLTDFFWQIYAGAAEMDESDID